MTELAFEVFYDLNPTSSNPFPPDDDDALYNLQMFPNYLSHLFGDDAKIEVTLEDYENQRIQIRIETDETEQEILSVVKRALSESHLYAKRI